MLRIISNGKIYIPCKNEKKTKKRQKKAMKCKFFLGVEFGNIFRSENYCFSFLKYTVGHM